MSSLSPTSVRRSVIRLLLACLLSVSWVTVGTASDLRIATFNVSLNRKNSGDLIRDLRTGDAQAEKAAAILRTVRPDVVLLNEFDYDKDHTALTLFLSLYLESTGLPGSPDPISYTAHWTGPVNTGEPSGIDLNRDGKLGGPADSFGFGWFPGQYGMVLLSRFPIAADEVRSFRNLKWNTLPEARRPVDPESKQPWHTDDVWKELRLSSKSHWDVPVLIGNQTIHILASHPTPPAFDGPEDRNGCRNADEIRLWAEYLSNTDASWLTDDGGRSGGLPANEVFCILGDLNADPLDGGSLDGGIQALLNHPRINGGSTPTSEGAVAAAKAQGGKNRTHVGPAAADTADFSDRAVGNLRADYVLPANGLQLRHSGVYWPLAGEPGADWIGCSDHRLVWLDVTLP